MTTARQAAAVALAAATLAVFVVVIALDGASAARLAPWPGVAVVVMAAAAFVLSGKRRSVLVAALLVASGLVGLVHGLVKIQSLGTVTFPGPIFGAIIGLPILALGVAKAASGRRRSVVRNS